MCSSQGVQVEAPLNHEQTYEVLRLLYELEECDDVGEVHHNAVLQDDVELKFTQFGKVMEYKKAFPEWDFGVFLVFPQFSRAEGQETQLWEHQV